ncbi:Lsr2 family DNA-binding protein [Streptomyces lunaelactis]|uniref:Lsr2 family DNA-binding protein n=1 Tax=Streptomyces lunaelactis TaxID=1535768 RepID=UPI0020C7625F|nr:hypothetical protein [Streptomyces lunaelactis]
MVSVSELSSAKPGKWRDAADDAIAATTPPWLLRASFEPAGRGMLVGLSAGPVRVRPEECAGWSFALEYGDSTGSDRLVGVSRDGIEAIHLVPMLEHPPATFAYAYNGRDVCGFGLGEENHRWGEQPDLLLPELVSGQVLCPGGNQLAYPEDEHYKVTYRRTIAIIEKRFGLSLPTEQLEAGRLPAYAVRGQPDMSTFQDTNAEAIRTWARANGFIVDEQGRVPAAIREAHQRATDA